MDDWGISALSRPVTTQEDYLVLVIAIWVVTASCIVILLSYRRVYEGSAQSIGWWYRSQGVTRAFASASVYISGILFAANTAILCAEGRGGEIFLPSNAMHLLLYLALLLPKLPPTELLFFFILNHGLWITAASYLALLSHDTPPESNRRLAAVQALQHFFLAFTPASLLYGDLITVSKAAMNRTALTTSLLCIAVSVVLALAQPGDNRLWYRSPPSELQQYLSDWGMLPTCAKKECVVKPLHLLIDYRVLMFVLTFVASKLSTAVWMKWLAVIASIRKKQRIRREEELEANPIPGVTERDMGTAKKK